jgi:nucleoside-diphosphate-sugar epimerase
MKILIIGGTRFFGKRFVQIMIDEGHDVTILTRGQSPDDFGNKVTRLKADRTIRAELQDVLKTEYDVVVDNMLMNAQEANDIITLLTNRVGHYVMTSTLSVYDPQPGALVEKDFLAENFIPKEATHPGESYQQGKRAAEHALLSTPFSVSIMRIPVIVGPDDHTQRLLHHIKTIQEGKKLYFPNLAAKFSFLHAKDAARSLAWLVEKKSAGTFNVAPSNAWSLRELMNDIAFITGKEFAAGNSNDPLTPFGIPEDYFMDVSKAEKAGLKIDPLEKWLPSLLQELSLLHKL